MKSIYVGNLSWETTDDALRSVFGGFGTVGHAEVITDRETGRSRGFGFVEMSDDSQAQAAIQMLNGSDLDGRKLVVQEARPRAEPAFRIGQTRVSGGGSSFGS